MGEAPLVTCCVLTYNYAHYLERAIQSILAQDYPQERLQIVVVDDGSTDNTPEVIKPYLDRVQYIRKENAGVVTTVNRAMDEAKGKYVTLLSADDAWPPDRTRVMVDYLENHPDVGMAYGDLTVIDPLDNVLHDSHVAYLNMNPPSGRILDLLLKNNQVWGPAMMIRATMLEHFHPIPTWAGWEDWWITVKIAEVADIHYIDHPVAYYRWHDSNMNLGATGVRRGKWALDQIPFRRFLLNHPAMLETEITFMIRALIEVQERVGTAVKYLERTAEEMYPVSDEQRATAERLFAEAQALLATRARHSAVQQLVLAMECNPWHAEVRQWLIALLYADGESFLATRLLNLADQFTGADLLAPPLVTVQIYVEENWDAALALVKRLEAQILPVPCEILLVDNSETMPPEVGLALIGTSVRVRRLEARVTRAHSLNFGAGLARGSYIALLDADIEPLAGWLEPMLAAMTIDEKAALVGSRIVTAEGQTVHVGIAVDDQYPGPLKPRLLTSLAEAGTVEVQAVSSACVLVRQATMVEFGGFDAGYNQSLEDLDLCVRAWAAGYHVLCATDSQVMRQTPLPYELRLTHRDLDYFHSRWKENLQSPRPSQPLVVAAEEAGRPPVSIILVTCNHFPTLSDTLQALLETTSAQDQIIVIDNASWDGTREVLDWYAPTFGDRLHVQRNRRNLGLARAILAARPLVRHEFSLLLHPDTVVSPGWIRGLWSAFQSGVGAVSPVVQAVAGGTQGECGGLALGAEVEVDWLAESCILMRTDTLGLLNPALITGGVAADLSLTLRNRGLRLLVALEVTISHVGGLSLLRESSDARAQYLARQTANHLFEAHGEAVLPQLEPYSGKIAIDPQTGMLSVLMVVTENAAGVRRTIESLRANTGRPYELILVADNATAEVHDTLEELTARDPQIRLVTNRERQGIAYARNQGLALAKGEYIALLRPGVVLPPGWIARMLALLSSPFTAIVGCRTNAPVGLQQVLPPEAVGEDGLAAYAQEYMDDHTGESARVRTLADLCLVMHARLLSEVGGFDTRYLTGSMALEDYCLRTQLIGYRLMIAGDLYVTLPDGGQLGGGPSAAEVDGAWGYFASKWRLNKEQPDRYSPADVIAVRSFQPEWDYIPLAYEEIYSPAAPPVTLDNPRPIRVLYQPDLGEDRWTESLAAYLQEVSPSDPVTLVIRLEEMDSLEYLSAGVMAVASACGIEQDGLPDILVETTPLSPQNRGGLYTAATILLHDDGIFATVNEREAAQCGLTVAPVSALRQSIGEALSRLPI